MGFKGITDIGTAGFTNQLAHNLAAWIDWSFLEVGAFFNVDVALSGHYGGDQSRLRRVDEPYYLDGQVYEGYRSNWVFESGIPYGISPINYSGVYVNNNFYPIGTTGTYSHQVNYPLGRVVFDNPVGVNDKVQCGFSFKQILTTTSEVPWSRTLMFDSMRVDSAQFLQQGSGIWNILAQNRVQFPVIVIDPTTEVEFEGFELGGSQKRIQTVLLYVFAETPAERNNLMDILLDQGEKTIYLYDVNAVITDNKFPLDLNGFLQPSGYLYNSMVDHYSYRKCTILKTDALDIFEDRNLYRSSVKWTCEVPFNNT